MNLKNVVWLSVLVESTRSKVISHILTSKGSVDLLASGTSMFPLIREREICRFTKCEKAYLRRGDILLYESSHGHLVAHRLILQIGDKYLCKGDSNIGVDEWISKNQIIGKMLYVRKRKRVRFVDQFAGKLWTRAILTWPFLSRILKWSIHFRK